MDAREILKKTDIKKQNHSDKKRGNYVIIGIIVLLLLFLIIVEVLKVIGIASSYYLPNIVDIPLLIIMISIMNLLNLIFRNEMGYIRYLANIISGIDTIGSNDSKKILHALKLRQLYISILAILLFVIRTVTMTYKSSAIFSDYSDAIYIFLPLIYLIFFEVYYFLISVSIHCIKDEKNARRLKTATLIIFLVFVLLLIVNRIPITSKYLYENDSIRFNLQLKDSKYFVKPQIKEIPWITYSEIPTGKLRKDAAYSFNGKVFEDSTNGISYLLSDNIESLEKELNIKLMNSKENGEECVFIEAAGNRSDMVICSDIKYKHYTMKECIFLNVSNFNTNVVSVTDLISSSLKPQIDYYVDDGVYYYFAYGDNANLAYIYDGNAWYEISTEGDKAALKEYAMSFERR